jgi:putative transposase
VNFPLSRSCASGLRTQALCLRVRWRFHLCLPIAPLLHQAGSMKKSRQLSFFKSPPRFFGGQLLHGRRRSERPLSSKEPLHLVMRSSWAMGERSFLRKHNKGEIEKILARFAKRHGIRIYRQSIVGNHLHLVMRPPGRVRYKAFVRAISGLIASHVMGGVSFREFKKRLPAGDGSKSKEAQGKGQQFWQFRPFSRVLFWGRDFKTCCEYVMQNTLEALGFVAYKKRGNRYAKWIQEVVFSTS